MRSYVQQLWSGDRSLLEVCFFWTMLLPNLAFWGVFQTVLKREISHGSLEIVNVVLGVFSVLVFLIGVTALLRNRFENPRWLSILVLCAVSVSAIWSSNYNWIPAMGLGARQVMPLDGALWIERRGLPQKIGPHLYLTNVEHSRQGVVYSYQVTGGFSHYNKLARLNPKLCDRYLPFMQRHALSFVRFNYYRGHSLYTSKVMSREFCRVHEFGIGV